MEFTVNQGMFGFFFASQAKNRLQKASQARYVGYMTSSLFDVLTTLTLNLLLSLLGHRHHPR